ncbi:hypothetical protein HPB49_023686 [Dermacentor silvarum]|uniref:Uncharacterized protein n=1 Tax=Dermacentor silvarum TaxID=543639 RepID=A0ACB8D0Q7_DERSI|nr:hypothetical protein HPB49_023686 [Dermacentor silvarum]
MSCHPEGAPSHRARSDSVDSNASRMNRSTPTEKPAYQEFRASASKVLAERLRERGPATQRQQQHQRPLERGTAEQTLQCNCCCRIVYDGWKAVHCEHVICIDCMVRTSQELIHCQVCIMMCYQDGEHNTCVVCFGCELLCRCPERLERVGMYGELRYRTTGRKPLEFYKRVTRASLSTAAGKTNLSTVVGDVPGRGHIKKKSLEREEKLDRRTPENLRRLSAKQQKMEARLKYLENCFARLQRRVEDLENARRPEALFQQFQEQQQPGGMYQTQFQEARQAQPIFQTPDPWQMQSLRQPYTGCDPMAEAFYQPPNSYQAEYPVHQNVLSQRSLFDAVRLAAGQQGVPQNVEGSPRRAFVAVVQMNSQRGSPDSGLFDPLNHIDGYRQQNDCRIGMESSIIIREISNDDEEGEYREETGDRAKCPGQSSCEPSSSSSDTNPIRNIKAASAIKPQKKDAETSVQMGTLVAELARLYDRVAGLEVDNERLRDDQRNLQKANAKMREVVKELQCEQACSRQTLPMQIQQPPLVMQTQIQQPQQTMSMHCGPGGASTTAVKLGVDAFVDNSSTQGTTSSSTPHSSDPSNSSEPSEARKHTKVDEEINIVVQNSPAGEVFLKNEATPAKTMAFTQAPTADNTPWRAHGTPQYKRTTSLPNHSLGQQVSDSELETYKRRVNDIMDWYNLCKRREAYLEQTTLAYLRQTLSNSCHFLDYDRPFRWELDKCLKLSSGKSCFRDFRVFSGPIIDVGCRGLIRFVVDPLPSSFCVYVEILISAKPKRAQGYVLRIRDPDSRKDFHCQRYNSEDMFGFRGVLSYPGTPCLGFFSIVVQVDPDNLSLAFRSGGRLLIELAKTRYDE